MTECPCNLLEQLFRLCAEATAAYETRCPIISLQVNENGYKWCTIRVWKVDTGDGIDGTFEGQGGTGPDGTWEVATQAALQQLQNRVENLILEGGKRSVKAMRQARKELGLDDLNLSDLDIKLDF